MRPEDQARGVRPAWSMLDSDLTLHDKFRRDPGAPWAPSGAPGVTLPTSQLTEADLKALRLYLNGRDSNLMVPNARTGTPDAETKPAETGKKDEEDGWSLKGPSRKTKEGGISVTEQRGLKEYHKSGYTRHNPDGTHKVDRDFKGKWDDAKLAGADYKASLFDKSAAKGDFGSEKSLASGSGSALGASAKGQAGFELSRKELSASAGAKAEAHALEGSIKTRDDMMLGGDAKASALKAEAEAKGEVKLTPEEATLCGKLGASVNLVEAEANGDLTITPRRLANPLIRLYNWAVNEDVTPLSEDWDIGFVVGAGVNGNVGAGAGASACTSYKKGKWVSELGAKASLGVGAGVKVRAGVVGLDKLW
ncbi:hypothetical protein [Acidimangrovimonas sediminis]|uniref:hypothetical protein n=1 Tax=Acidimangrovimonas sediminis TaxID=2056283 RepID=UPI0011AEFA47|nr:hypothetical protein [Acidimangrovimonas sediminis]